MFSRNNNASFGSIQLVVLFIGLFSTASFSQDRKIDSLKVLLKNATHDTTRLNVMDEWAVTIFYSNPDSALLILTDAKNLAEKNIRTISTNDPSKRVFIELLGSILNKLGAYYRNQNPKMAIDYYNQSLKLREQTKDSLGTINTLNNMGSVYKNIGNIIEALNLYNRSLRISEIIKDTITIGSVYNNIANIYALQNQTKEALDYYNRSLKISESLGDKNSASMILSNIAGIYVSQNQLQKALTYFLQSLKIFEENDYKLAIAVTLANIADVYETMNELGPALDYSQKSIKLSLEIGDISQASVTYVNMSEIMIKKGKLAEALDFGKKGLALSKESKNIESMSRAAQNLKVIYQKLNKPLQALEMYELHITMRDSVNNEESRNASYKTMLQYEFDKKSVADSIKTLEAKKVAAAKLAESTAKLKQEKTQRFALYGGLALLLGFSGFIYNRFKNSQRQKRIIEQQKIIVEESQSKIVSSINYAKKIQYSILPSESKIGQYFKEHFIVFKPKDIVSGDFYWFHQHDNLSFIAVVDCTGHGVPGAFMTMIAHSILNEVVIEQKITQPDQILKNLHSLVFKSLQQEKGDEYSQDGMDISLCVIDHVANVLHFSGAHNSAFLIEDKNIKTLKAIPKSIGGLSLLGEVEPEREFKLESMEIKKDTLLILTTDGIFDQLNAQDEKFGSNRFKEMILNLDACDSGKNKTLIDNAFHSWKQTAEQLDDVLLVGIQL